MWGLWLESRLLVQEVRIFGISWIRRYGGFVATEMESVRAVSREAHVASTDYFMCY